MENLINDEKVSLGLRKTARAYFVYDRKDGINVFSFSSIDCSGRSNHFAANQAIINSMRL